jgi:biopolymer transport protein ExbB/TolQ
MDVFANAETLQKLIIVALLVSAIAALVVLALKLRGGQRLAGGSAFLSGLRLGGPILGGFGACLSLLNMSIGYANVPGDLPLKALAPGFAEAFFVVGLGFLAGAVAVFANWAVESRIDRSVLKA